MGFWWYLYLIINLATFIYYYKKNNGIIQAPFLMAYTALFIFIPQFSTIYNNSYYDKTIIPYLGFTMISCNIAFIIGFEISKNKLHPTFKTTNKLMQNKIKMPLIFITLLGLSTIFLWDGSKFQEGDNVIQTNLKSFSQTSLCLIITSIITSHKKNKFTYFILILSLIPLIYFAFFIKGSRGETLFLLLTTAIYISYKHPNLTNIVKRTFITLLIFGALLSASIVWVRSVISDKSNNTEIKNISLWDNFIKSFSQDDINSGMDLGNAAIGIQHLYNLNKIDFGTHVYDEFIQNIIPRRIVGESLKEKLKLNLIDDKKYIESLTNGVTTMTGYYYAFRSFSFLGFILFFFMGFIYGYIYIRTRTSAKSLFLYLLIISSVPLIFTHGPGYLFIKIYINFTIGYIFCHQGFKKYIIKNG